MNIKAFAFDMDGTLLSNNNTIHSDNIKAIREASKQGFKIIIASGRPYSEIINIANKLKCVDYIVANNGSCLYDIVKSDFFDTESLPVSLFHVVRQRAKETQSLFALHTRDNRYKELFFEPNGSEDWITDCVKNTKPYLKSTAMDLAIKHEPITQLSFTNDKNIILKLCSEFQKKYGNEITCHISSEVYLDINPNNTSKLTGISKVLVDTDINLEHVMVFGDSGNDIQMVTGCGYGVAMGNANDELKKLADCIIGVNTTNAIAKKIWEIIS